MSDIDQLAAAIRNEPTPAGFADRVMDRLPAEATPRWLRLWDAPLVQALVWVAACLVLIVRVGSTVALFLPG